MLLQASWLLWPWYSPPAWLHRRAGCRAGVRLRGRGGIARRRAQAPAPRPHRPARRPGGARLRRLPRHPLPPERRLWRDAQLPFEAKLFHRGLYQREPVRMHEVTPPGRTPAALRRPRLPLRHNRGAAAGMGRPGTSGLRIHYPLNTAQYKDELVVFLGASYFRALGAGQQYGLSARGLAIDTVGGPARNFPASPSSGWSARRQARAGSTSMPCWTRRARPAPTASRSCPAPRR